MNRDKAKEWTVSALDGVASAVSLRVTTNGAAHETAIYLLLDYINDPEITKAYESIPRWQ